MAPCSELSKADGVSLASRLAATERDLAICKMVLLNTYTTDVLDQLMEMYGRLVGNVAGPRPTDVPSNACEVTQPASPELLAVCSADANVQTDPSSCLPVFSLPTSEPSSSGDDPGRAPTLPSAALGVPSSDASTTTATDARWDCEFHSPTVEREFLSWYTSRLAPMDTVEGLALLACTLSSVLWLNSGQDEASSQLFEWWGGLGSPPFAVSLSLLLLMALLLARMLSKRVHAWYTEQREAVIVAFREAFIATAWARADVLLDSVAYLVAGCSGSRCKRNAVINSLACCTALLGAPPLFFRLRFSRHLLLQVGSLTAAFATLSSRTIALVAARCNAAGLDDLIDSRRIVLWCAVAASVLPAAVVYVRERHMRRVFIKSRCDLRSSGCGELSQARREDVGKGLAAVQADKMQ